MASVQSDHSTPQLVGIEEMEDHDNKEDVR